MLGMMSGPNSVTMAHLSMCLDRAHTGLQLRRVKNVDLQWLIHASSQGIFLICAGIKYGTTNDVPLHMYVRDTYRDLFYVSPQNVFTGDSLRNMPLAQAQQILRITDFVDVRLLTHATRACNKRKRPVVFS